MKCKIPLLIVAPLICGYVSGLLACAFVHRCRIPSSTAACSMRSLNGLVCGSYIQAKFILQFKGLFQLSIFAGLVF